MSKGLFDVETRLPGKSGAASDPLVDMEDRIETFLEAEGVNYIDFSGYLKALSIYEEKKKCEA